MATGIGFSAYSSTVQDCQAGTVLQFDTEVTDIGDFYNKDNSIFICPQDGLYLFSVSAESLDGNIISAGIIKEGIQLLSAYHGNLGTSQGSSTVIAECNAFQSVWIECRMDGQLDKGRASSFSGVLITPYA